MTALVSGVERFTTDDMRALAQYVHDCWATGADRDWSRAAGTLEWSCLRTADHAVDCVYAPAFFLASRRLDAYPVAGSNLELGGEASPAALLESLRIATRILCAVVETGDAAEQAAIFNGEAPVIGHRDDFVPRAALELILHAHDVCAGLDVAFDPPAALCGRLREHTRPWPVWGGAWAELGASADPWADLRAATGR